jgi:hypothetical protein
MPRIEVLHNVGMVSFISRIVLATEVAVLVLLAGILAVITAFGAMGITSLTSVFYFVAFSIVCLALIATADLAVRRVRGREIVDGSELVLRAGVAFGGAVIATALTAYGGLFLSANERWVRGLDFMSLGCFLWIPLVHLSVLIGPELADKRRMS